MQRDLIGNIRTFDFPTFRVSVDALIEQQPDYSFDETGKTAQRIESGELVCFCACATVYHKPTGIKLAEDFLSNCIYTSIEAFQNHREAARDSRRRVRREGLYQIYRKNRKYPSILTRSDKLRKRGLATRELAATWADANVSEPYEIFKTATSGSYFSDMVSSVISEARKEIIRLSAQLTTTKINQR